MKTIKSPLKDLVNISSGYKIAIYSREVIHDEEVELDFGAIKGRLIKRIAGRDKVKFKNLTIQNANDLGFWHPKNRVPEEALEYLKRELKNIWPSYKQEDWVYIYYLGLPIDPEEKEKIKNRYKIKD